MENVFTAYKLLEQSLRYLSAIAEQSDQGIAVTDLDGCIRFVNNAWIEMHGYNSKDEFIGKQLSIFHTEEQMNSEVAPMLEETKRSGQIEGTVEHIKSDGTVFPTQTKIILVESESCNANTLVVFTDSIQQNTILQEATLENLKRIEQLSDLISQFRRLFGECVEAGEFLAKQTSELQSNNEILFQQFIEFNQPQQIEEQGSVEIVNHTSPGTFTNQLPEDESPGQQLPNGSSEKNSELNGKSKRSMKPLNTKELGEVAELARRLS